MGQTYVSYEEIIDEMITDAWYMVADGDVMYRKSLERAIQGQEAVRKKLTEHLQGKN